MPSDRRAAARAWCLYDWANSGFATSATTALLPTLFTQIASREVAPHVATAYWGYASAAALAITVLIGPFIGAVADHLRGRKPLLLACVITGALATVLIAALPGAGWGGLLGLFAIGFVAFASGNVLYDSLLPAVASPEEMHRVSARGFAYGYIGGGVLLAFHLLLILMPERFGLPDATAAMRLAIGTVGLWWLGFSIPLFRSVPEPWSAPVRTPLGQMAGTVSRQLWHTLLHLRRQPDLFRFLVAFWLYSDGIGTIMKMAVVYGRELGIDRGSLIGALLMVQILAAPASIAFGRLAHRWGPQRAVLIGLVGYMGITVLGFFLSRPWHFWALSGLVALFQGGTQALSRSMFASLVPRDRVGEMFGFYSVSEKLAGVIGPLLFGLVAQATGEGRLAVLTLLPFFVAGSWLLMTVNLARGATRAAGHEASAGAGC